MGEDAGWDTGGHRADGEGTCWGAFLLENGNIVG